MKKRIFNLCGHKIEVFDFGYKQYMYPAFNGNAEFEVSAKGFRKLSSYLRTCDWHSKQIEKYFPSYGLFFSRN